MKNDFVIAITQLSVEKNLDSTTVFEAVEAAMASALKKDELQYADVVVKIDQQSGEIHAWRRYTVTPDDEIEDDEIQVSPERAREMGQPGAKVGEQILEVLDAPMDAGRIAAQTAKQVVLQRLREAERDAVFEEFMGKEGDLVAGAVLRVEPGRRQVIIDLGRTEAVLPTAEQVRAEHYRIGQRLRLYVKDVYKASKGPQVVVSRSHPDFLRRLFELEVPEVARGVVEIVKISRDPGYRSKIAVVSRQNGIDAIGACVGVRGSRIQNVINELGGERIDLIRWDPNEAGFAANSLSPAEVVSVRLDEETHTAFLAVPDKQLSLAIGKEGQNARLAAKLTGWRIDIRPESALIAAGDDFYPPPERHSGAVLLPEQEGTATATVPRSIAPSQATYARPGLPGEGAPMTPARTEPTPAEAPALAPEQEAVAAFRGAETAEEEPAAVFEREMRREEARGLRFAEEIRDLPELDEESRRAGRGGPAKAGGKRRPGAPVPERVRPAAARRTDRRFEIDEEEIEEGLIELHGGPVFDDDGEDAEDA